MSIYALPTKIDNHILAFLDQDALNAVSKTSKTYRVVSEPFLYRHLKLTTKRHASIRWLVITLLQRPELAAHIKTIELLELRRISDNDIAETEQASQLFLLLEQAVVKLHQTIRAMLGSDASRAETRVSWTGAILGDDYVDVEGCLTLIACLAYNIECLTVNGEVRKDIVQGYRGQFLTTVMWEVFQRFYTEPNGSLQSAPTLQGSRPFQRLQDLHVTMLAPVKIIMLPQLRTIRVENSDEISVSHLFPKNTSHPLHTYGSAYSIRDIFSEGHAIELKRLVLREFCAFPDQSCQPIIDILIENCLDLEYLELDILLHRHADEEEIPLTGFDGLTSLSTLRIDLGTLVDSSDQTILSDLNKLLPPKLHALHITGVSDFEFWCLFVPWFESDRSMSFFLADSCTLEEVSITVDFDEEMESDWESIETTLAHIATNLWTEKTISLQIYRSIRENETAPALVFDREGFHEGRLTLEESEIEAAEVEESDTE